MKRCCNFKDTIKTEMDRVKNKLKKITESRTQGAMLRSKARWYEFGEKNSKYFYNLERRNCKKKHITSLTTENNIILSNPKLILEEEANFYKQIYSSKSTDPENKTFASFFESVGLTFLNKGEADQCEGLLTLEECAKAISNFQNDKTPGSDGFTVEFYRRFGNLLGKLMVDSFNYAFQTGNLSISQRLGIISLIPKKDKNLEFLKNWRPITLLNTDYKIATKAIAMRLEKVLPKIIHPGQAGYIEGRYIGECIRTISDIMSFTIKGIDIAPGKTAKLAQYADDTTVFVKDDQSIKHLFNLLEKFERVSGLRINQSKSELLWLGQSRLRKDKILNLNLSEKPIYALGIHFSYNDELVTEKKFYDKLVSLKKILNIWSSRDISIYGKINIVKTLALSKLTFVCSVLPMALRKRSTK